MTCWWCAAPTLSRKASCSYTKSCAYSEKSCRWIHPACSVPRLPSNLANVIFALQCLLLDLWMFIGPELVLWMFISPESESAQYLGAPILGECPIYGRLLSHSLVVPTSGGSSKAAFLTK